MTPSRPPRSPAVLHDLTLQAYPGIVALAVLVGVIAFAIAAHGEGLPVGRVLLAQAGLAIAGLLAGRLHLLLEISGHWTWQHLFQPGYRQPGALLGVLLMLPVVRRLLLPGVPLGVLGDCLAVATPFALVVLRLGCFGIGCCFGTPTALPWGLRFPAGSPASEVHAAHGWIASAHAPSLPIHPLQLYFLVLSLGVGVLLLWLRRHKRYDGQVLLVFLTVHELGKFLLESFRQPLTASAPLSSVPFVSLGLALSAAALLVLNARRGRRDLLRGSDQRHRSHGEQPVQQDSVPDRAALHGKVG